MARTKKIIHYHGTATGFTSTGSNQLDLGEIGIITDNKATKLVTKSANGAVNYFTPGVEILDLR